ncbi:MAG: hypothetical protein ACI808_002277 [Paraglaciecola sp.]|jgi:hypothetical protein
MKIKYTLLLFMFSACFSHLSAALEISGIVQANVVKADEAKSWLERDTGVLAYSQDGLNLQQVAVKLSQSVTSNLNINVVANYYQSGDQHLGLSQAELIYKPLSADDVKWKARVGFFYPKMSLENVDIGWLSPYSYTQSAINSWIGEELKTPGIEVTLYSPGRPRNSAFSWEFHAATFKGNDPLGTIISWRGFAMHDRQSLHNERVSFAPYPTVVNENEINHPAFVEPFHELDGRLGYYLGAHLDYYQKTKLRYYYYDNRAEPLAINSLRLYGWRTKFHSIAGQHNFNNDTRVIGQLLTGSSAMGERIVFIDFDAWYLMLSHKIEKHRLSLRYDKFKVRGDDARPLDNNNSKGYGLTLAWRYNLNKNWQVGVEQHINQNSALNRQTLGQTVEVDQQQSLAVVQFRWR